MHGEPPSSPRPSRGAQRPRGDSICCYDRPRQGGPCHVHTSARSAQLHRLDGYTSRSPPQAYSRVMLGYRRLRRTTATTRTTYLLERANPQAASLSATIRCCWESTLLLLRSPINLSRPAEVSTEPSLLPSPIIAVPVSRVPCRAEDENTHEGATAGPSTRTVRAQRSCRRCGHCGFAPYWASSLYHYASVHTTLSLLASPNGRCLCSACIGYEWPKVARVAAFRAYCALSSGMQPLG